MTGPLSDMPQVMQRCRYRPREEHRPGLQARGGGLCAKNGRGAIAFPLSPGPAPNYLLRCEKARRNSRSR